MKAKSKSSVAYMMRNFWQLIFVALPCAVLLAFCINGTAEAKMFVHLANGTINDASTYLGVLTSSVSLLRMGNNWWLGLIALPVLCLGVCLLVVKIDRHMRIGEMALLPIKNAFGLLPIMLFYVIICVLAQEVLILVVVGITYFVGNVGGFGATVAVGTALTVLMRMAVAYLFALLLIAFPLRYGENYHFNIGLSYSVRIMFKRPLVTFGFALVYPILKYAGIGLSYLLEPVGLVPVLYSLLYTVAIMYIPCLGYTIYYQSLGNDRKDVATVFDRR